MWYNIGTCIVISSENTLLVRRGVYMFQINDYVLYQEQVCQIKEQKKNEFTGLDCYILVPLTDASLRLNVPVDNPNIKTLMSEEEIKLLIHLMPRVPVIDVDDKMLENEYKKLYHSGNKEDLIRIIKTTYMRNQERLSNNKKISEKDNRYFLMAENLLYEEIAAVLHISSQEAKEYVLSHVEK